MAAQKTNKWSGEVTEHSDALDLKKDIFKSDNPKKIAESLKRSAEHSHRRKSNPFRSALSMLTFLYQSCWPKFTSGKTQKVGSGKGRAAAFFWKTSEINIEFP
jgi:hypothetical protein